MIVKRLDSLTNWGRAVEARWRGCRGSDAAWELEILYDNPYPAAQGATFLALSLAKFDD
jgi:hypothetical protein